MGRYDGPHFEVEDDVVSVWIASCPLAEMPENYFALDIEGEDEDPFNEFSSDFGFGYYDIDFVETNCNSEWHECKVGNLIEALSYSGSFLNSVVEAANKVNIDKTSYVFLIYNFKYDPTITNIQASRYMQFLGAFSYDRAC